MPNDSIAPAVVPLPGLFGIALPDPPAALLLLLVGKQEVVNHTAADAEEQKGERQRHQNVFDRPVLPPRVQAAPQRERTEQSEAAEEADQQPRSVVDLLHRKSYRPETIPLADFPNNSGRHAQSRLHYRCACRGVQLSSWYDHENRIEAGSLAALAGECGVEFVV